MDFIDDDTGDIYDMTTPKQMQAHIDKCGTDLNRLDTSGETIEQLPPESEGLSGRIESAVKSGAQAIESGIETGTQAVEEDIMPIIDDLPPP
ncbi:hypothetical protein [Acidocella sp.]|uniref:hypothetical protein n=1 Tax=Acidocella sp. TaxID=50710 RepID=UPI003D042B1A